MKIYVLLWAFFFFVGTGFSQDYEEYSEEFPDVESVLDNLESSTSTSKESAEEKTIDVGTSFEVEQSAQISVSAGVESALENENAKKNSESGITIHWLPISICAGISIAGGVMAYFFDTKAKDATTGIPLSLEEYEKGKDDANKYQTLRTASLGVMAAGLVGIGVTFLF
jgi:hypothetical protein